jgi:hypothetical protein
MHRYAMLEENATNGKAAGGLDFYRSFFFQYLDHRRDREAAMDGIVKDRQSLIEMFLFDIGCVGNDFAFHLGRIKTHLMHEVLNPGQREDQRLGSFHAF